MRRLGLLAVLTVSGLVTACQTPSPQLQIFRTLSGEAQLNYARSLAIEDRLDLYHALYSASGHPNNSSLAVSFAGTERSGFDAVMARIDSRSAFYEYIWVLKLIDKGEGIDLCQPRYVNLILQRATALGLSSADLNYLTFDHCSLDSGRAG